MGGRKLGVGFFPAAIKFVCWYSCASLLMKLSAHQYGYSGSELPIVINLSEGYKVLHRTFPQLLCLLCTRETYLPLQMIWPRHVGPKRREASASLSKSRGITLCLSYQQQTQPQFLEWKKREVVCHVGTLVFWFLFSRLLVNNVTQ